jgi:hypothetical protein
MGGEDRSTGIGEVSTGATQRKAAYVVLINQQPTTPPAASNADRGGDGKQREAPRCCRRGRVRQIEGCRGDGGGLRGDSSR